MREQARRRFERVAQGLGWALILGIAAVAPVSAEGEVQEALAARIETLAETRTPAHWPNQIWRRMDLEGCWLLAEEFERLSFDPGSEAEPQISIRFDLSRVAVINRAVTDGVPPRETEAGVLEVPPLGMIWFEFEDGYRPAVMLRNPATDEEPQIPLREYWSSIYAEGREAEVAELHLLVQAYQTLSCRGVS